MPFALHLVCVTYRNRRAFKKWQFCFRIFCGCQKEMKNIIFRIDDIGASTKHFNQHGQKWFKLFGKKMLYFTFSNFWFFKRIKPFKKWGKYDELTILE